MEIRYRSRALRLRCSNAQSFLLGSCVWWRGGWMSAPLTGRQDAVFMRVGRERCSRPCSSLVSREEVPLNHVRPYRPCVCVTGALCVRPCAPLCVCVTCVYALTCARPCARPCRCRRLQPTMKKEGRRRKKEEGGRRKEEEERRRKKEE